MTNEEQDAIIGRIVREHTETKKQHDLLIAKAFRASDSLQSLSNVLRTEPMRIAFDGESLPSNISRMDFDSKEVGANKVKEMCNQIREYSAKLSRLESEKKKFGL